MKKNYFTKAALLVVFVLFVAQTTYSQERELVWADEFDYTGLPDKDKWFLQTGSGASSGNQELQYYTDKEENAYVDNGVLTITAREESYMGDDYTSARLSTRDMHQWKYGRIEARLKLPTGKAMWPAFWMLGDSYAEIGWPACGEIDILEVFCDGESTDSSVWNTLHWDNNGHAEYGNGFSGSHMPLFKNDSPQEFHVYALEWDASGMEFYVDSELSFNVGIGGSDMTEFHEEFFLILNLAVGGDKFPFNYPNITYPDESNVWPQTMEVDYVRVYSDPSYFQISGSSEAVKSQIGMQFSLPYDTANSYNWTIPVGAALTGGALDSNLIVLDWACNSDSVNCQLTTATSSYELVKHVEVIEQKLSSESYFVEENETGIVYSVTETYNAEYEWSVPAGASIVGSSTAASITVDWGTVDGEVSCLIEGYCDTVTVSKYIRIEGGQFPYPNPDVAHAVPGSINSTDYDYGGEGVAYHDLDANNQGSGPRSDDGVDTEYGDGVDANVGWIGIGEWLEYTIEVEEAKELFVELRVASPSGGGPFSISVNGKTKLSDLEIPKTGSWSAFESFYAGKIAFTTADTLLRYDIGGTGYNFGKIVFHELDETAPSSISNLQVDPSATTANATWDAASDDNLVLEYNVYLDGELYSTVAETELAITGLTPEEDYTLEVVAVDWQGNLSTGVSADFTTTSGLANAVISSELINVYPNPATDKLYIATEYNLSRIVICDHVGRQLIEKNELNGSIDISSLENGVYYMILDAGESGSVTKAFVKR